MTAELMVTLQEIKIYALKQKGDLLRGGRAIPEQVLEDKPEPEDFDDDFIEGYTVPTALVTGKTVQSDDADNKTMTLAERIAQQNQISIDEAIKNDADSEKLSPPDTNADGQTSDQVPETQKIKFRDKVRAFRDARAAWQVEKYRADEKYSKTKQKVLDRCVGYDDIVMFIDNIIAKERVQNVPESAQTPVDLQL